MSTDPSPEPTSLVIFGGTGDRARRKLLPALFQLGCKGRLPDNLKIVGFARQNLTDNSYQDLIGASVREFGSLAPRTDEWTVFAKNIFFVPGDLDSPGDYAKLKSRLETLEEDRQPANRLFYLSVAPRFFGPAVANLGSSGLAGEPGLGRIEQGWRRAVIEKPIGRDLGSAQALNESVGRVFDRSQAYRIDHYLG